MALCSVLISDRHKFVLKVKLCYNMKIKKRISRFFKAFIKLCAITKTIHMLIFSANKSQVVVNQSSSSDTFKQHSIIEPYLMSYSKKDFHALCYYNTFNWERERVWRIIPI